MKNSPIKIDQDIFEKAKSLEIANKTQMSSAVLLLSQCNKALDRLTEECEKITKPMNEALKEVRARYKPAKTLLSDTITSLRSKMSVYQTEQTKVQFEAEAKIAIKVAEGKLSIETGVAKIEALGSTHDKINTDSGAVKFKAIEKLKITNADLIPRAYLLPDEKLILDDLKAGKEVPGAILEEIQIPINYRK